MLITMKHLKKDEQPFKLGKMIMQLSTLITTEQAYIYQKKATNCKRAKVHKAYKILKNSVYGKNGKKIYYLGKLLLSSLVDKVIDIMETCRVCSTLFQTLQIHI